MLISKTFYAVSRPPDALEQIKEGRDRRSFEFGQNQFPMKANLELKNNCQIDPVHQNI